MVVLLSARPWGKLLFGVEESNFVLTKPPIATLWHEMMLSGGDFFNNTRPSIRALGNNHAWWVGAVVESVRVAFPATPEHSGRVGEEHRRGPERDASSASPLPCPGAALVWEWTEAPLIPKEKAGL